MGLHNLPRLLMQKVNKINITSASSLANNPQTKNVGITVFIQSIL